MSRVVAFAEGKVAAYEWLLRDAQIAGDRLAFDEHRFLLDFWRRSLRNCVRRLEVIRGGVS